MTSTTDVLVIGAGIAGMKASLLLASAGRRVYLIENSSVIGGRVIRYEDVFPAMECATCMVSPMQQDVLVNDLIEVVILGSIQCIEGSRGNFRVKVLKKASLVDPVACIGCAECWNACPVNVLNDFEENLSERSAISVPCAGALPNVPWIDKEHCLRWNDQENCHMCMAACIFEAIDFSIQDSELDLVVSDIILSTGFEPSGGSDLESFGWGKNPGVFTASEFERYFSSNGPTDGKLTTKDGRKPSSVAIIVNALGIGSFSHINTMYSLKFLHYFKKKLPDTDIIVLLDASYSPGHTEDIHHHCWQDSEVNLIEYIESPEVSTDSDTKTIFISCKTDKGLFTADVDMIVLGTSMHPSAGTSELLDMLDLHINDEGYPENPDTCQSSVHSGKPGVFIAGAARGPANIATSVTTASAAVGRILANANWKEK